MKWASETLTPGQITLLRVLFGFVPILAYAIVRGSLQRAHLRYVHHFVMMSVLATSLYYFAFASGTALLPSGVAGALSGAIPLFSFMASAAVLRDERITAVRTAGVVIGFGGVLLIARPWSTTSAVVTEGVIYMLAGAASVGLSFVYAKRFLTGLEIPPAALSTYQIGIALVCLSTITDYDGITAIRHDATALVGLVAGLGATGTGLAYIIYYVIVERLGAIAASSVSYLPPVVALAIGWVLVGEPILIEDGLGVVLILVGVVLLRPPGAWGPRIRTK